MPTRVAALFAALKASPGELSSGNRRIVVIIAALFLIVTVVVFVRTTWNAELSNDVIAFTGLFVITALVLVGYARSLPTEIAKAAGRSDSGSDPARRTQREAPPPPSGEAR